MPRKGGQGFKGLGRKHVKGWEVKHAYIAVIVLAIVAAGIFVIGSGSTGFFTFGFEPSTSIYILEEQEQLYRKYFDTDRPLHCAEGRCISPLVYEDLPDWPDDADFQAISTLLKEGKIKPVDIGEEFYKQPEFFPSHVRSIALESYLHPGGRPTVCCEGAYPGKAVAPSVTPGETGEFSTFFLSAPGNPYFRGAQFIPVFPQTFGAQGEMYTQNPEKVKEYFEIVITPDVFKFEPTYPKYMPNWNTRVVMDVRVSEDTPPGHYAIGITLIEPPEDINYKWQLEHLTAYTSTLTGGMFSASDPPYLLVLNVL